MSAGHQAAVAGQPGTVIEARGVVKSFDQTPALRGATVSAARGEVLAIMGPSGSGKSTLLHCLAGILVPDEGEVWFAGSRLDTRSEADRSMLRRDRFGFVFQSGQLVPELTAEENVALPLLWCGTRRGPALAQARAWFGRLGLDGLERRRSGELSGGQAQRVALARGLVARPDVIFADEPTGSLDSVSGEHVMSLLTDAARQEGTTVILVTHEARVAAYAARRVIVRDGTVTALERGRAVIRLGLRLTFSGREAVIRLVVLTAAVGLGTGLLLIAVSGINAVNSQNDRYAWFLTGNPGVPSGFATPHAESRKRTASEASGSASADPLCWLLRDDVFDGQVIYRVDVAVTGPTSPVPPGIPRDPGPGQYYASPALAALLKTTPAGELGDRYPGHLAGMIGDAALPSPDSLVIVVGDTAAQLAQAPGAVRATSISATPPSGCDGDSCVLGLGIDAKGLDLVLPVVALAMLVPVLVFIATATRLSAARREQRFAAMRLTGAVPRQVSVIAAVESTVAAVGGMAAGFGIFFGLRGPLAAIPFTGHPFFPGDLSLRLPDILIVTIGVPVAAAVAARLALHRVHISPLGVTRRVTPVPPGAWRVLPLLAGLAELGFWVVHGTPKTIPGQVQALLPGFALVMAGLVLAGPWLTMAGARITARRTSRAPTLIAARRLADNPRAAFRAVSGLVLALFITTVAAAIISTQDAKDGTTQVGGATASNILVDMNQGSFTRAAGYEVHPALGSAPSAALLARLRGIHGDGTALVLYADPGLTLPGPGKINGHREQDQAGLVSCAQLAKIPALGRCPAGAAVAAVSTNIGDTDLATVTWPAAHVSARHLDRLGALGVFVATSGSARAVEQARTLLETAYPDASGPATFTEASIRALWRDVMYRQLADVVILVSLPVAGCTLAASIAAGLADRKRPFSMMRLAGAPLSGLQRVVALESAVPLLAVAAVAIGTGFGVSAMYATMQLAHPLVAPDAAYYLLTAAGIAVSLGIIAATFPLLRRITGPEVARNE